MKEPVLLGNAAKYKTPKPLDCLSILARTVSSDKIIINATIKNKIGICCYNEEPLQRFQFKYRL